MAKTNEKPAEAAAKEAAKAVENAARAAALPKPESTSTAAVPAKEPAAEAAPARAVSPLIIARWSEAQFIQARHAIRPEVNTPFLHLLDPAYYANIAPKLNAGDILEVRPAEGSYYAELYVWGKGPNWAQVSLLRRIDRPADAALPSANKAFSIEFVEGPFKHRVIRNSDRAVVAHGFDSPDAANAWLLQNGSRIAA